MCMGKECDCNSIMNNFMIVSHGDFITNLFEYERSYELKIGKRVEQTKMANRFMKKCEKNSPRCLSGK